uniref:C2H2-type domain-containing protein n=1 Tax=Bursaphelenchus xylophilus TaxID=6326 RepID=A0A1I7SBE0_BURXY
MAFKFRSNLYQHNCPERVRQRGPNAPIRGMPGGPANGGSTPNSNAKKRFYTRGVGYTEIYDQPAMDQSLMNNNMMEMQMGQQPPLMYDMPFPPQENPLPMQMNEFGYNMNQFDVKTEPVEAPVQSQSFEEPQGFVHDVNSVHTKPLDPEYIDQYLQKNKHRIYTCKKCKLNFPHREYLQRHMAYHNDLDNRPYGCAQCPQRFHSPKQLESHQQKHAEDSPHRCQQCGGGFRSALALRRHKDQSRQCYCPPFGVYPQLMASPNAPLDQYAFIDSDNEADDDSVKGLGLNRQKSTTDSGMGSDSSTHSFTTSPVSARNTGLDEDLEHQFNPPQHYPMAAPDSKEEEGFRSRLNSATTQSCSPGSSFSGDSANSPGQRKFSSGMHGAGAEFGYNLSFQYQQSAQHHASMGYQYQQGAQHQHNVGNVQYNANFSENFALSGNMTAKESFKNLMTKNMTSSMGNSINLTANVPVSSGDELFSADDSENPRRAVLFEQIQTKVLAGKSELMLENFDSEFGIEADDDERMPQEKFSSDIVVADPEDLVEMEIKKCIRTFLTLFLSTAIDVSRSKSQ